MPGRREPKLNACEEAPAAPRTTVPSAGARPAGAPLDTAQQKRQSVAGALEARQQGAALPAWPRTSATAGVARRQAGLQRAVSCGNPVGAQTRWWQWPLPGACRHTAHAPTTRCRRLLAAICVAPGLRVWRRACCYNGCHCRCRNGRDALRVSAPACRGSGWPECAALGCAAAASAFASARRRTGKGDAARRQCRETRGPRRLPRMPHRPSARCGEVYQKNPIRALARSRGLGPPRARSSSSSVSATEAQPGQSAEEERQRHAPGHPTAAAPRWPRTGWHRRPRP